MSNPNTEGNDLESEISELEKRLDENYELPNLPEEFHFEEVKVEPVGAILEIFNLANFLCEYYQSKYRQLYLKNTEKEPPKFDIQDYRKLRKQYQTNADQQFLEQERVPNLEAFFNSDNPFFLSKRFLESEEKSRYDLSWDFTRISAYFDAQQKTRRYASHFDNLVLEEFFHSKWRQNLEKHLQKLRVGEKIVFPNPDSLRMAEEILKTISSFVKIANSYPLQKKYDYSKVNLYLRQLGSALKCRRITGGFHLDWEDNCKNSINSCIHNNKPRKKVSYDYSLDSKIALLFFRSVILTEEEIEPYLFSSRQSNHQGLLSTPTAEVVLIEAEENGKKELVVDGLLFDHYFWGLQPEDGRTIDEVIISAILQYARAKGYENQPYLNLREVCDEKELATLYFVKENCRKAGQKFQWKERRGPDGQKWFTGDNNCEAYQRNHRPNLRKQKTVTGVRNQKLYTHTWGDLWEDGGITTCDNERARAIRLINPEEKNKNWLYRNGSFTKKIISGLIGGVLLSAGLTAYLNLFSVTPTGKKTLHSPQPRIEQLLTKLPADSYSDEFAFLDCSHDLDCTELKPYCELGQCEKETKTISWKAEKKEREIKTLYATKPVIKPRIEQTITPAIETVPKIENRPSYLEEHLVKRIIDGDSFILGNGQVVRLICVDAPEGQQNYADKSEDYLHRLIFGKKVGLERDTSEKDHRGQLLRYVYIGNTFVNEVMLKNGLVKIMRREPNLRRCPELATVEKEAQQAQRGIWSGEKHPGTRYECDTNIYNCSNFKTQAEAQRVYDYCNTKYGRINDVHRLDGTENGEEEDGIACNNLLTDEEKQKLMKKITSDESKGIVCNRDSYNCDRFNTQEDAQQVYEFCKEENKSKNILDVHGLDKDKDGIACEGYKFN